MSLNLNYSPSLHGDSKDFWKLSIKRRRTVPPQIGGLSLCGAGVPERDAFADVGYDIIVQGSQENGGQNLKS